MSDLRVLIAWTLLFVIGAVLSLALAGAVMGALVWFSSVALVAVQ